MIPDTPMEFIAWAVGFVISVLLEVFPVLQDFWTNLKNKKLWLTVFHLVAAVIIWALACFAGVAFPFVVTCGLMGLLQMLWLVLWSLFGASVAWETVSHRFSYARARNG